MKASLAFDNSIQNANNHLDALMLSKKSVELVAISFRLLRALTRPECEMSLVLSEQRQRDSALLEHLRLLEQRAIDMRRRLAAEATRADAFEGMVRRIKACAVETHRI